MDPGTNPAQSRSRSAPLVARLAAGWCDRVEIAIEEAPRSRWVDDLRPAEARWVIDAHAERRASFAAGRHLARRALARLGAPDTDLGRIQAADGSFGRAPAWPEGFVGSLSHTGTHCAAVVAGRSAVWGVGLDLEAPSRMKPPLIDRICTPAERERLRGIGDEPEIAALCFAAKEAFYKLWQPATGQSLGFREAEVHTTEPGCFSLARVGGRADPPRELAGDAGRRTHFEGVWAVEGDLLAALIVVPTVG